MTLKIRHFSWHQVYNSDSHSHTSALIGYNIGRRCMTSLSRSSRRAPGQQQAAHYTAGLLPDGRSLIPSHRHTAGQRRRSYQHSTLLNSSQTGASTGDIHVYVCSAAIVGPVSCSRVSQALKPNGGGHRNTRSWYFKYIAERRSPVVWKQHWPFKKLS